LRKLAIDVIQELLLVLVEFIGLFEGLNRLHDGALRQGFVRHLYEVGWLFELEVPLELGGLDGGH